LFFYLTTYAKIKSKQIKDLSKAIKLVEENVGINPHEYGLGNGFLDMTPKSQNKTKIWISTKCKTKQTSQLVTRLAHRMGENMCSCLTKFKSKT
jgi:hypothetical protein